MGAAVAERPEPKRWLSKAEGVRHLIHTAIRPVISEEDPFAVNLLAQSSEKVLLDLIKHAKMEDPFSFEHLLRPEYKKEFFAIYREPYNFLKHADKDHDGKLPVYSIVRANDVLLLGCIVRFSKLYSKLTTHMSQLFSYIVICYPQLVDFDQASQVKMPTESLQAMRRLQRSELLETFRTSLTSSAGYHRERALDLVDVVEAGCELAARTMHSS